MPEQKTLSQWEKEERAAAAKNLLNDPTLKAVFDGMEEEAVAVFRSKPVGDLTAASAHARILAITEIRGQLTSWVNDEKMIRKPDRGI
jgi:hypothetical protein